MHLLKADLLFATARTMIHKNFFRTVYKEPFSYESKYRGLFDYHDHNKYPKRLAPYKEEELLEEVHAIRALEIENPSPFHVVTRIRSMKGAPWFQKVTLRRLNLHSSANGDCAIIPNTPQFNALLQKVKHFIKLKPAIFANGRIPTEEDIGAIKVCPSTGTVTIDEKLRLQSKRLNLERPVLFQGNHLRSKINALYGLSHNQHMR